MPIRAFVGQNLAQLQVTLSLLEKALQFGNLSELRAAGIMSRSSGMTARDVQLRYQQCRYELFLRVKGLDPADTNTAALQAQFTNPYLEKVMKVYSRSSVGAFGYPLPAPEVPPVP